MAHPAAPRRRLFALSAGLAAGALAAPHIARADDCTEDTLDRIKRTRTLNLGVRDGTPPYGWKDANGNYVGFATDIARGIHAAVSTALGTTGFTESGTLASGQTVTGVTLTTNDTTSSSGYYKAGTFNITPATATGAGL